MFDKKLREELKKTKEKLSEMEDDLDFIKEELGFEKQEHHYAFLYYSFSKTRILRRFDALLNHLGLEWKVEEKSKKEFYKKVKK